LFPLGFVLRTGAKLDGAVGVVIAVHQEATDTFAVSAAFVLVPVFVAIMDVH
jgi:hypothetical protein